jgi:O-antigen/teichoic acid export membrane protein
MRRTVAGLGKTASLTVVKSALDAGIFIALVWIFGGPEALGKFGFVFVLIELFHRLSNFGGHRHLIQRRDLSRDDVSTVAVTEGAAALLWTVVWIVASPALFRWLDPTLLPGAQLVGIWLLTERIGQPARALLEREMCFGRSNGAMLCGTVALGLVAVPLALAGWGVEAWLAGKVAQSAATSLLFWVFAGARPRFTWSRAAAKPFLRFGLPLTAAELLQFFNSQCPILVLRFVLDDWSVIGLYYAAYRLPEYLSQLQALVSTVVYPAFTRTRDDAQLLEGFRLVTKYSAAVVALPFAIVLALGLGVTAHLLPAGYRDATLPLQILTGLVAFRMTTVNWHHVHIAKRITWVITWIAGVNAIGVVVGILLGVRIGMAEGGDRGAIVGVAIGVAVASIAALLLAVNVYLKRLLPVRFLPLIALPCVVGAVTCALGLGLRAAGLDQTSATQFWTAVAAMTILYVLLGLALDRRALRDLWKRARA